MKQSAQGMLEDGNRMKESFETAPSHHLYAQRVLQWKRLFRATRGHWCKLCNVEQRPDDQMAPETKALFSKFIKRLQSKDLIIVLYKGFVRFPPTSTHVKRFQGDENGGNWFIRMLQLPLSPSERMSEFACCSPPPPSRGGGRC
ncbi:unnamed protein product [Larinioides sclopetarius]|uniref:Uncharacterized protein n=1 Tax=Larinioides sclopetarius TaxID=280406 RepID=A0AAV1YW78_9ARAC